MKLKALILLSCLFVIPIDNIAASTISTESMNAQLAQKKKKRYKKKGGFFKRVFGKKKCKCPKN